MSNRTAAIALAAITGCVSIISIATSASGNPASAPSGSATTATSATADECLAAPKATTPAGAHWYYRVEKGTKRKCWYLGDAGAKTKKAATTAPAASETAEQNAPPPTQIVPSPKQETAKKPIQKSVADARAELIAGADEDPSLAETTWPPMPDASANTDVRSDNQAAAMQPAPEANKQDWNIATRWPDPNAPASASDQPSAVPQQPTQAAQALTPERLATAATPAAAPAPARTTGAASSPQPQQPAAAVETESMWIRILLSILVGVLALAAILAPMLFKYFRPKVREDERTYGQRRPIWDLNVSNDTIMQDNPPLVLPLSHDAHALPEPRVLPDSRSLDDDAADEIEQLLTRASKRSAA
jgi:hypothetical protein